MKYLTVDANCVRNVCETYSIAWDEDRLGEPTEENIARNIENGFVDVDVVDTEDCGLISINGVNIFEEEDQ